MRSRAHAWPDLRWLAIDGPADRRAAVHRVSRSARLAVYAMLAAVLGCGLFEVEAWPLTGWKLFSEIRTDESFSWQIIGADGNGTEQRLGRTQLGDVQVLAQRTLDHWFDLGSADREAVCQVLLSAALADDADVVEVRLYRVRQRRFLDDSDRVEVVKRIRHHRCKALA